VVSRRVILNATWYNTFIASIVLIIAWAVCGPAFHYSDTWQLVINTGTTIITFLMVFLIQNTQNRDTTAIQLKLDELLRANENARNQMLRLADLTENQLHRLKENLASAAPVEAIREPLEAAQQGLAPHIYTDQEIGDLLTAAWKLPPSGTSRPVTYETIFGLIAATGLRISEALNLRCGDVDLDQGLLTIRKTKFRKSRHVPVHRTVVTELRRYMAIRQRYGDTGAEALGSCHRRVSGFRSGLSIMSLANCAPVWAGPPVVVTLAFKI
jgi:low affinity Fe/Cu permease